MALGLILGRAGAASTGFRTGEEQARKSRERQLQIEEQNRLDQFRREAASQPLPAAPEYQRMAAPKLGVEQVAPPEPQQQEEVAKPTTPERTWDLSPAEMQKLRASIRTRLESAQGPNMVPTTGLAAMSPYSMVRPGARVPSGKPTVTDAQVEAELRKYIQETAASGRAAPSGRRLARRPAGVSPESVAGALNLPEAAVSPEAALNLPQTPQAPQFGSLANAVEMVESGGNMYAVNPKSGASGSMQTMAGTLRDPGFGVTPAQDDSPEEKRRVGRDYLAAMLNKFGGNVEHALAAYNWGPANAEEWIAAGADPNRLPAETRDYIPKVLSKMGAQPGVQVAQAAGAPAQAAGAPVQAYVGEEQSIPMEFQRMGQVREELARLAGMYQRSGMGQQFMEVRAKILELDAGMTHLQGMQGLQELAMSNDPRRLAAVWSMYYGQPINIQPRSDGTYNVLVNGQLTDRGISATELSSRSRAAFDSAFRQQQSAATAEFNAKQFESRLKQQEDQSKLYGEMIKDIAVERTKGNLAQALEYVKANAGWEIKPVGSEGMVLIRPPGQSPFYFTPQGQTITIDGIEVQSNAARPIAGLPSYAPMG